MKNVGSCKRVQPPFDVHWKMLHITCMQETYMQHISKMVTTTIKYVSLMLSGMFVCPRARDQ